MKKIIEHKRKFIWPNKINIMGMVLIFIGVAVGIFVTVQWKTEPLRSTDPVLNYSTLQKTKEKLTQNQENYKLQIKTLNEQASNAQQILKQFSASEEKVNEVEDYEIKVGLTNIQGAGIKIFLSDAEREDTSSSSISHAADLRDIVNLLWGGGAKAISINNERIVFNTSIDCIVNTILINSTKTTPPFEIMVVGDSNYLYYIATNPNFLKDIHNRVTENGLIYNVEKSNNININAFTGSVKLEYAKLKP
jgi:uncharacterized protein YlxW (UPF0749 family)